MTGTAVIINVPNTIQVFSADQYFLHDDAGKYTGVYKFNPGKLPQAHAACLRGFIQAVQERSIKSPDYATPYAKVTIMRGVPGSGKSTWVWAHTKELGIVVDNTSPNAVDVAPYAAIAQAYGFPFEVVTIRADPAKAAARNLHGVPAEFVEKCAKWLDAGTPQLMPWWPHRLIEITG